jgi:hypothetical protein
MNWTTLLPKNDVFDICIFENWPTNAAGRRPRWNSETGNFCVSHFFGQPGPGCIKKAVGRLKK